ncbi:MAG: hypothetical protein Q9M39_04545 [Sulfurovum sp.]|nr:hypothetical protein [Sulfurovum sp.]
MKSMTVQFTNNTQNFIQGLEQYISKFQDVSMKIEEKISLPTLSKKIYTPKVENLLEEEAKKNNLSVVDYLNYMIAYEKEKALVVEDMKIIKDEMRQVNNGTLKLQTLDSLIAQLDD